MASLNGDCSNEAFGVDPAANVQKSCSSLQQAQGFRFVANGGYYCNFVHGRRVIVRYGSGRKYIYKEFAGGMVACTIANMGGDPNPGIPKTCYYAYTEGGCLI